jgi:hypothetical protein
VFPLILTFRPMGTNKTQTLPRAETPVSQFVPTGIELESTICVLPRQNLNAAVCHAVDGPELHSALGTLIHRNNAARLFVLYWPMDKTHPVLSLVQKCSSSWASCLVFLPRVNTRLHHLALPPPNVILNVLVRSEIFTAVNMKNDVF